MFVVAIEPATRAVVIGPRDELLGRGVVAREVNWLVDPVPPAGAEVAVQIRHRARAGAGGHRARRPRTTRSSWRSTSRSSAITPGAVARALRRRRVLGGGVIERGRRELPVRAA